MSYDEFLTRKQLLDPRTGMTDLPDLNPALFEFQADIVRWALRRGRAALFAGTGLGKSLMELEWARHVAAHTGKPVLILAPLAVAAQFIREADKFGEQARHVRMQSDVGPGVNITNYEKLDHFDASAFGGIVLDESSILKAFDGKTRSQIIASFRRTPFRLAATATPAPNDFMELGNHAEFLGVMSYAEMLAMFFVHDGGETQSWRLKGHAESDFWRWMCSWAVMLRKPSDLGYDDGPFTLPPMQQHQHTVGIEYKPTGGYLFPMLAETLQERIGARRDTITERVECAAGLIQKINRPALLWCNLNSEQDALEDMLGSGFYSVRGSMSEDAKETAILGWINGERRHMISKPSIMGFGLNFQHCADMIFVGLNDSWEQVYQAVRRCWRFGQTRQVNVHFVASEIEGNIVANLARKDAQAAKMAEQMVAHMADINRADVHGSTRDKTDYNPSKKMELPKWLTA